MNDYRPIIALAIFAASVVPAFAELSALDALSLYRKKDAAISLFINGLGQGYSWVNTDLAFANRRRLFCIPHTLVLTVDQQIDIVDRHLKRIPADGELPVGAVLLAALKETFPCPNSN